MKNLNIILLSLLLILASCSGNRTAPEADLVKMELSQSDSLEIVSRLRMTEEAWNNNDLELYMTGYWKSDSLLFVGSRGPTYGYDATLENYKRGYPDKEAMGKLTFDIIDLHKIDSQTALLIGKFYLGRTIGDMEGYYTLVWQKINGEWLIISDHSSGAEVDKKE